jgi:hypothetical protein
VADLKSSNHREALTALRDILADHMLVAEPAVSAQIAARLQAVMTELASMPSEVAATKTDQLRARRDARRGVA